MLRDNNKEEYCVRWFDGKCFKGTGHYLWRKREMVLEAASKANGTFYFYLR